MLVAFPFLHPFRKAPPRRSEKWKTALPAGRKVKRSPVKGKQALTAFSKRIDFPIISRPSSLLLFPPPSPLLLLFCYHFRGSILGCACVHSSAPNQRLKQSAKNPHQGVGLNESIITKPVNGLIASCFARPAKWQGCTIMPTHLHFGARLSPSRCTRLP